MLLTIVKWAMGSDYKFQILPKVKKGGISLLEKSKVSEAIRKTRESNKKSALATVVHVYGSAYRQAGASMLIDEDKNQYGMISGGCLESDVALVAEEVINSGHPILKKYEMDEDLVWGLGLGCPGKVEIYIQPI